MKLLKVNNLKKKYADDFVVKGINFVVNEGEILGFLGPNGAGKSTTINILATALKATQGEIEFQEKNILKDKIGYKKSLGIVPQTLAIFESISAIENVKYFGSLYGLKGEELKKRAEEALDMVGLLDKKKDLPKTFSGGMKRRLNIACALAHRPKLLILDEPTVGIDPQSRNHILESIKTLRDMGTTVIYTTHYMEEVEAICDRVLIMDKGKILSEGSLEELKNSLSNEVIYNISGEGIEKINKVKIKEIEGVNSIEGEEILKVVTSKDANNLDKIILALIKEKVVIKNIATMEQNLETIFLNLTGRTLRD